ncbi:MAG: AAA family ATPase [Nitrososphaerota archaeon]
MINVTIDHIISAHILAQVPLLINGYPGIGKTHRVRQIGEAMGRSVVEIHLHRHMPEDIGGYPRPDDKERAVDMYPLKRLLKLPEDAILFIDEFGDVDPRRQAVAQQLVYERRLGDFTLPESVAIVCAGNPQHVSTDGYGLSLPMSSRMGQVDFPVPTPENWLSWSQGHTSESLLQIGRLNWKEFKLARPSLWMSIIGTFFTVKSSLLFAPPSNNEFFGKPWPSPRGWAMTADVWQALSFLFDFDKPVFGDVGSLLAEIAAKSCVGDAAAAVFSTWIKRQEIPSMSDLLEKKVNWKPDRIDVAYVAGVCMLEYLNKRNNFQLWKRSWDILAAWSSDFLPVCAFIARDLLKMRHSSWGVPDSVSSFLPAIKMAVEEKL